jgi:hypothetical protein
MIEEKIKTKIRERIARGRTLGTLDGTIRNEQHFGQLEGWVVEANNIVRLAIPIPQNA